MGGAGVGPVLSQGWKRSSEDCGIYCRFAVETEGIRPEFQEDAQAAPRRTDGSAGRREQAGEPPGRIRGCSWAGGGADIVMVYRDCG